MSTNMRKLNLILIICSLQLWNGYLSLSWQKYALTTRQRCLEWPRAADICNKNQSYQCCKLLQLSDGAMNQLTWVLIPGRDRVHSPICLHSVVYNIRQFFFCLVHNVQDLRSSQQCWRGFELSGMWLCVTG